MKPLSVTIPIKTFEQYCHVVLFIMMYKMVLTFKSVEETLSVTIPIKTFEQYCHVVLFIMMYNVVLTFKSVEETLVCDHSNENF